LYTVVGQRKKLTSTTLCSPGGTQKVYTELLAKEFGQCRFLHYGLIADDDNQQSLQLQQQAFADNLFNLATKALKPEAKVLLVGGSLHYLESLLVEHGCTVTTSENYLIETTEESYDLLVLEATYHYLQQLPLLSKARELLGDSGRLLVFGEYLDDDSRIERSALPNLSSMRQLSKRLSFTILEELNFRADAIYSIEELKRLAAKHESQFNNAEDAALLTAQFQSIEEELKSNRRSFNVFLLEKSNEPEGEYALAEYAAIDSFDPLEIKDLFEKSFDAEFNLDVWQWKYELGEGKCVVARASKDGNIVSHYGGAPRQIQYFGESNTAIQVCDVMVLPEIRRQYGKSSLFFKTAATFLEREIGNTVNHLLGFGFPNQKAMNIALRLGLYEKTDDFVELVFPRAESPESNDKQLIPVDISNQQHQSEIDELWEGMKQGMVEGIVGDRHWRYIKYRYFDHPFAQTNQYRCCIVRDSAGAPVAFVVLKEHEQRLLIMDLICPAVRMKQVILDLGQLLSDSELKLWITHGWIDSVRTDTAIENKLGIEIPCNFWNPGPSSKILYGAWWLTAGDMDFM